MKGDGEKRGNIFYQNVERNTIFLILDVRLKNILANQSKICQVALINLLNELVTVNHSRSTESKGLSTVGEDRSIMVNAGLPCVKAG